MGVLDYQSEEFPIEVQGLSPAKFGHRATLWVYNLTRLDDLDGVFQLAAEKTPSAQGSRCCLLRNERGVAIRFAAEQNGGDILFDANGVTIAVASEPIEVKIPMIRGSAGISARVRGVRFPLRGTAAGNAHAQRSDRRFRRG